MRFVIENSDNLEQWVSSSPNKDIVGNSLFEKRKKSFSSIGKKIFSNYKWSGKSGNLELRSLNFNVSIRRNTKNIKKNQKKIDAKIEPIMLYENGQVFAEFQSGLFVDGPPFAKLCVEDYVLNFYLEGNYLIVRTNSILYEVCFRVYKKHTFKKHCYALFLKEFIELELLYNSNLMGELNRRKANRYIDYYKYFKGYWNKRIVEFAYEKSESKLQIVDRKEFLRNPDKYVIKKELLKHYIPSSKYFIRMRASIESFKELLDYFGIYGLNRTMQIRLWELYLRMIEDGKSFYCCLVFSLLSLFEPDIKNHFLEGLHKQILNWLGQDLFEMHNYRYPLSDKQFSALATKSNIRGYNKIEYLFEKPSNQRVISS